MLVVFVKNARITSKWYYSVKKNRRDSNFFFKLFVEKYFTMVYVVFSKKNQSDPGRRSQKNQIFLRKKMLGLYQNMEIGIDLHLISHQVFLKVQIITYKMKKKIVLIR